MVGNQPRPFKITVFSGNRSEFGLLRPVVAELASRSLFEPTLLLAASHVDPAYGATASEVKSELDVPVTLLGSEVSPDRVGERFSEVVRGTSNSLAGSRPDACLVLGDRYESFAFVTAAFYADIPVLHIFGGDVSMGGHWDDSARHAMTKLAHIHFTASEDARARVLRLGEEPWRVHHVGSPALDTVARGEFAPETEVRRELGLEGDDRPLVLLTVHPVAIQASESYRQAKSCLDALAALPVRVAVSYPSPDRGAEGIIAAIEEYRSNPTFTVRKSFGSRLYLGAMRVARCVVGNSSSGLLETPFFKIPCVNVGDRQAGRLRAGNVVDVGFEAAEIRGAVEYALGDAEFLDRVKNCGNPYGDGTASVRIAEALERDLGRSDLLRKKITY
jgi:UDP-hydrolysing UDP-N-acetyl-D-glucosamine 2-epimerase